MEDLTTSYMHYVKIMGIGHQADASKSNKKTHSPKLVEDLHDFNIRPSWFLYSLHFIDYAGRDRNR